MFQVTIPAADVNILDTWYVAGLTTVGPATNCADQADARLPLDGGTSRRVLKEDAVVNKRRLRFITKLSSNRGIRSSAD